MARKAKKPSVYARLATRLNECGGSCDEVKAQLIRRLWVQSAAKHRKNTVKDANNEVGLTADDWNRVTVLRAKFKRIAGEIGLEAVVGVSENFHNIKFKGSKGEYSLGKAV